MLAGALCTAIDAALAAEQYSTAKKAHFSFSSDDIRAMGISLYIGCHQTGDPLTQYRCLAASIMLAAKLKEKAQMNDHESRISALEQARKELEDAMIVMAHLEKRQTERATEHATYIANHEQSLADHDKRMKDLDVRIDRLVSAIGEWISRMPAPGGKQS